MKRYVKAKIHGHSITLRIEPADIERFNIEKNDIIEYEITNNLAKKLVSYKCKKCEHQFSSDDDVPYCPACDNKDLEEDKE